MFEVTSGIRLSTVTSATEIASKHPVLHQINLNNILSDFQLEGRLNSVLISGAIVPKPTLV